MTNSLLKEIDGKLSWVCLFLIIIAFNSCSMTTASLAVYQAGKIGRLPWQPEDGYPVIPFGHGKHLTWSDIIKGGERLKTFSESVGDEKLTYEMHKALMEATRIVFLGFSFLEQNIDLLIPPSNTSARLDATSYGLSLSNRGIALRGVRRIARGSGHTTTANTDVRWHDMKAGQFFADFGNEIMR